MAALLPLPVQSVGTTPVILGRKVKTAYTVTPRYIEVDIDLTTNTSVSYIVKMVQVGALQGGQ